MEEDVAHYGWYHSLGSRSWPIAESSWSTSLAAWVHFCFSLFLTVDVIWLVAWVLALIPLKWWTGTIGQINLIFIKWILVRVFFSQQLKWKKNGTLLSDSASFHFLDLEAWLPFPPSPQGQVCSQPWSLVCATKVTSTLQACKETPNPWIFTGGIWMKFFEF